MSSERETPYPRAHVIYVLQSQTPSYGVPHEYSTVRGLKSVGIM
jgi:hypothetical protein